VRAVIVARLDELRPRVGVQVRVDGRDYAVWLVDDATVHVLDNSCLHTGGPLVDGAIRDGCIVCPWHGWRYDLATGTHRTTIGDFPGVGSYRAWVDGGDVWAELPE
jgi:nitrite reductase/ring-hydroxylating ferredoxin subunit